MPETSASENELQKKAYKGEVIRHPAFAARLKRVCDDAPWLPATYGRISTLVQRLQERGSTVTREGVRKWLAGIAMPQPETMKHLAEILDVDLYWLRDGSSPVARTDVEARVRALTPMEADLGSNGAVFLTAGLIRLDGGKTTFPVEAEALRRGVNLTAMIRGGRYEMHVATGEVTDNKLEFETPPLGQDVIVLVVMRKGLSFKIVMLNEEALSSGAQKGTTLSHSIDILDEHVTWISDFERRL